MTTPIRITPETPPQLPCYLWSPRNNTWMHASGGLKLDYGTAFTHWLPDQPTAPEETPDDWEKWKNENGTPTAPTVTPQEGEHTAEADFQHYLTYSNQSHLGESNKAMLRHAFFAAWEPTPTKPEPGDEWAKRAAREILLESHAMTVESTSAIILRHSAPLQAEVEKLRATIVLGHPATPEWCKAVDEHHASTEQMVNEAQAENRNLQEMVGKNVGQLFNENQQQRTRLAQLEQQVGDANTWKENRLEWEKTLTEVYDKLRSDYNALREQLGELTGDRELIDWLARRWDSQGQGHYLMGGWIPNTTGSFRDAVRSARLAARPTEEGEAK